MEESYENALKCLHSRKAQPRATLDEMRGLDDMSKWIELLGYSGKHLDSLNIIHVAGTDGKGSTSAYIASILKASGKKVGLYTSPHLRDTRERIRINGRPISDTRFAAEFFEVWEKLPKTPTMELDIPRYLQLLALLSFHVFIKEKVDVAVYEAHMGGRYDATNVIQSPIVAVITHVAKDHVRYLGPNIEKIAWHKAGILKTGCLAFSSIQEPAVEEVLNRVAAETEVTIKFISKDTRLPLATEAQRENCSLAVAAANAWLSLKADGLKNLHSIILDGIKHFSWPGRYDQFQEGKYQWFLDGAHNESSLSNTARWFAEACRTKGSDVTKILIFAHFSKRNSIELLRLVQRSLISADVHLGHVIFTTYKKSHDGNVKSRPTKAKQNWLTHTVDQDKISRAGELELFRQAWRELDPDAMVWCEDTVEDALNRTRIITQTDSEIQTLVTGSLHLVGPALDLLGYLKPVRVGQTSA
ncbi:Mur ligase [Aspergillus granulosus]|uniref:tetrahydrofolate synthase n=1 Tax=Aspergillus granulosus TaxID=176169 RepID=A0ABR4GZL9_9EURO